MRWIKGHLFLLNRIQTHFALGARRKELLCSKLLSTFEMTNSRLRVTSEFIPLPINVVLGITLFKKDSSEIEKWVNLCIYGMIWLIHKGNIEILKKFLVIEMRTVSHSTSVQWFTLALPEFFKIFYYFFEKKMDQKICQRWCAAFWIQKVCWKMGKHKLLIIIFWS